MSTARLLTYLNDICKYNKRNPSAFKRSLCHREYQNSTSTTTTPINKINNQSSNCPKLYHPLPFDQMDFQSAPEHYKA